MRTTLFLVLLLTPANAFACKCANDRAIEDYFGGSDTVVFSGKVIETASGDNLRAHTVKLEVLRAWKGKADNIVEIDNAGGSSCAYGFKNGESYVVFASEREGKLATNSCSGNALLAQAKKHLAWLKKNAKGKR